MDDMRLYQDPNLISFLSLTKKQKMKGLSVNSILHKLVKKWVKSLEVITRINFCLRFSFISTTW